MKINTERQDICIKAAALTVFAVLFVFALVDIYRFRVCFKAADKIPHFSDVVQIRFTVYGFSGDTVSAVFHLYDSSESELATVERSWNGSSLYIDFVSARFNGICIYFPRRIYSTHQGFNALKVYRSGTQLSRYYMNSGECLLYDFEGARKSFSRLCRYALRPDIFGTSQRVGGTAYSSVRSFNLGSCIPGESYVFTVGSDDSLVLKKE